MNVDAGRAAALSASSYNITAYHSSANYGVLSINYRSQQSLLTALLLPLTPVVAVWLLDCVSCVEWCSRKIVSSFSLLCGAFVLSAGGSH